MRIKNFAFQKYSRLRTSRQFQHVSSLGEKRMGRYLIVHRMKVDGAPKLGITVSKHFGKAHDRNRFKRVVREAFRLSLSSMPSAHLNIKPRKDALNVSMNEIRDELVALVIS